MTQFLNRKILLEIGTEVGKEEVIILPDTKRVSFSCKKTPTSEPNKLEVSIYNLNKATRQFIEQSSNVITVKVAYEDECIGSNGQLIIENMPIVSRADLSPNGTKSTKSGADIITRVSAAEGLYAYSLAVINKPFGKDISVDIIFDELINAFKDTQKDSDSNLVNRGLGFDTNVKFNITANITKGKSEKSAKMLTVYSTDFLFGVTLSGMVEEILEELCDRHNLIWFFDNNIFYIFSEDGFRSNEPFKITKDNGLIGTPQMLENGKVSFQSLINTNLLVWSIVEIESSNVNGIYQIGIVEITGDNYSNPWYSSCECLQVL